MSELRGPALLFCPADRPERFGKAAERADSVIIDLEDAVAPADKPAAREHLMASDLDPERTIVRVNPAGSADLPRDLAAVRQTSYRTLMLAKTESAEQLEQLGDFAVIALCETARGIAAVNAIAAESAVIGLMWGAEDLLASLGGTSSRNADGLYRDVARLARANTLLAAAAHGKAAIDAIHGDIADTEGLSAEVLDAVASGFAATACIHPSQVQIIRRGYAPTEQELGWARGVLEAATTADSGVFTFEGKMIDEPLLRHARRVLNRTAGS